MSEFGLSDDRWRDSYDEWKLRSPYDDCPDEPECDHEEYEVDWEGRATCNHCREHWWLTSEQLQAYDEAQASAAEEYDREMRRYHSLFWRAVDWVNRVVYRLRLRFTEWRNAEPANDDIPF